MRLRVALICALTASALAVPAPVRACASAVISLADFRGGFADPFYAAVEGSPLGFVIERGGHDCQQDPASVDYDTPPASAIVDGDYTRRSESDVSLPAPGLHNTSEVHKSVPTTDDAEVEGLERFMIGLDDVKGAALGVRSASGYIIDNDGAQRFLFGPFQQWQNEVAVTVRVPVIAAGPISESASIGYAIEAGSATEGEDYTGSQGTLSFTSSERLRSIEFKILNDTISEGDETLFITLSGGTIEGESSKTYTIIDNEEQSPPVSRFHHPKKGVFYNYNDYRIREVHVFTSDDAIPQDTGVTRAQLALRRKMLSGACKWWDGDGFSSGPCSKKKWIRMRAFDRDFYFYKFPALRPSVGTAIKKYTAYSRATDAARNIESDFDPGRNANNFEIRRRKKG